MTTTPDGRAPRGPVARVNHFVRGIFEHVPASLGGHLHRLPPRLTFGITGPFNGQRRRTAAVAAMFGAIPFRTVIETGTYRALTTRHLRTQTEAPVATIEVNPSYFRYSRARLSKLPKVAQFLGKSPAVLEQLRTDPTWKAEPVFFYLDAHWLHDLPLLDELASIRRGWTEFAALIDDFAVDGDDGYFFDDYGPGKRLDLRHFAGQAGLADLHVFWPAAPSASETGARRGWVVLSSSGAIADALSKLPELRSAGALREALAV
ncbi:MAG TPA: hypothetical protein VM284_07225 [Candidatus Limnocylindria bacterium]|nr:hypothetical protein [Candidatus Limnocylindria bacterium]